MKIHVKSYSETLNLNSASTNGCVRMSVMDEWHSWRKIADYAADVIQSIATRAECSRSEREQCYVLLNKLANQPINSAEAERIIIRLHVDIE
jgi:hypothetical protein